MTLPTRLVLHAFLEADTELYGLQICELTGLAAGTIYPILQRLTAAGWVQPRWEPEASAHTQRRPPRRYYQLSPEGRARTANALHAGAPPRGALARLLAPPPALPEPRS
jgi:DNA-binding PadR family transcriptional regulator